MLWKNCFGTKVIPVTEEVTNISICDSKNNNVVDKVVTEVPTPKDIPSNKGCFTCCFWWRSKNEVAPFVQFCPNEFTADNISGDRENGLKPVLARQSKYAAQSNGYAVPVSGSPPQPARFVSPIPSPRVASPVPPLIPSSPAGKPEEQDDSLLHMPSTHSLQVEDLSGDNVSASEEAVLEPQSLAQEIVSSAPIDEVDTLTVQEERLRTPPPVSPPPTVVDTEPDTTQSEELIAEEKTPSTRRKFGKNNGKPRLRSSNRSFRKENNVNGSSPDILPFDKPKDALNKSLQQLDHPEWEVTIQGLQSLVRLSHNHTGLLHPALHQVVVAVTKHVRNLRSQVARVACKAATHLFKSVGRGIENEMDDLCSVLLTRTADTNKFLRADCNTALDAMVDHVSCTKSVASIVNKGAKHQNAVVRATACRLLLRLCERLGPEKVLSLPRDTRDAIINTGARSLTEGSLDTRRYAKEMFILLSQDPRLPGLLQDVVPTSIMRSISKVLARITAK